ncbi:MAG: DEAD/DEAH box helicase [Campylobacter sp.]
MKFEPKDKELLRQIGVTSLLDLALKLPFSFDDTTLSQSPKEGNVSIEIEIKSYHSKSGILHAISWCEEWKQSVKIVIFNAKQWHFASFKSGKKIFISGKCTYAYGSWQVVNPKIITKINEIIPKYKLSIRNDRFKSIIEKYINFTNLLSVGLNEVESKFFVDIHKNDEKSVEILDNLHKGKINTSILKFAEIYNYLKKLNLKKTHFKSQKIELFDIRNWIETLPFSPTNDQLNAINDLRTDFTSKEAKRRVVMGDVGSGKTLVILAAALMIYPKTAIVMAPTSILVEQIYNEAKRLLPEFMRIRLVKSGEKNVEFDGENLIIGTHVLLYKNLPNSPLIMIDEQHRFGSNQREKINAIVSAGFNDTNGKFDATTDCQILQNLENFSADTVKQISENDGKFDEKASGKFENKPLKNGSDERVNLSKENGVQENLSLLQKNCELSNFDLVKTTNESECLNLRVSDEIRAHVVQFSATPIPRTLSMIQSSFVEFSFLKQMPFKKHIRTQILQSADFGELLAHIKAQLTAGKQVAVIYPLVETSENSNYQSLSDAQGFWQSNFKNVFVTHGKDKDKEQKLLEFRERGDILLSTTVVEVGISLPRLSTIVIVGAERLGLASLHQLRGRVGRNGGSGFCFLFTKLKNPPERLKEFCETLDGFKIAEIDLKNRQSGDILNGTFQHGATFEYYNFEESITQMAKQRLEKA